MITLNGEKGLIRVESWDDIESRPGFVADMNPVEHRLDTIIGRYIFRDRIHCGLSNCHTPHAKGYIVVTTDGYETNIGKDCGKREFGVDFDTLSRQFDRDITEAENRERLWSFSFTLEQYEECVADLRKRPFGADWAYKRSRSLVSVGREIPDSLVRRLHSMIKTRTAAITRARVATEEEAEEKEAATGRTIPRPAYVEESVGQLDGLAALYPENDIRELLIIDIETNLRMFREKEIDSMTFSELKKWVKWVDSIDSTLEKAEWSIAQARNLLRPENLRQLQEVLEDGDERRAFLTFLRKLEHDSA